MNTATPMGSMVFTVMAALAQMGPEMKRERIADSGATRRAAGKDLGGRLQTFTDSLIRHALRLIQGRESATRLARDLGMSRPTLYSRIRELPIPAGCVRAADLWDALRRTEVTTGDRLNDADTARARSEAERWWDSGARRVALAEKLRRLRQS